ncbi:MAG: hypothetical protein LBB81_08660 [Treponema sp.]|jgi:4-alpha-glucanotransferase|nr:hypothetical protein [Treponema sp.]
MIIVLQKAGFNAPKEDAMFVIDYFGIKSIRNGGWTFIRAANTAIIPMQDFPELDDKARMNTPTTTGNRRRRMPRGAGNRQTCKKNPPSCTNNLTRMITYT